MVTFHLKRTPRMGGAGKNHTYAQAGEIFAGSVTNKLSYIHLVAPIRHCELMCGRTAHIASQRDCHALSRRNRFRRAFPEVSCSVCEGDEILVSTAQREGVSMVMSEALSSEEVQAAWAKLTEEVRTGVLLTLRNGRPFGSHVPHVVGVHRTMLQ